jgi:hypothetical protein
MDEKNSNELLSATHDSKEDNKTELTPEGKILNRLKEREEELIKKTEEIERREADLNRLTKQLEMGGEANFNIIKETKKEETNEDYAKKLLRGEV